MWAPDALAIDEWRWRGIRRVLLPIYDLAMMIGGVIGAYAGIPAIEKFFPETVTDIGSAALAGAGFACFIGVAIPRAWLIEAIGKLVILALLAAYGIAIFILAGDGDLTRGFVLIIAFCAMLVPAGRLAMITGEIQERHAPDESDEENE